MSIVNKYIIGLSSILALTTALSANSPFETLPDELKGLVIEFLPARDIQSLAQTSRLNHEKYNKYYPCDVGFDNIEKISNYQTASILHINQEITDSNTLDELIKKFQQCQNLGQSVLIHVGNSNFTDKIIFNPKLKQKFYIFEPQENNSKKDWDQLQKNINITLLNAFGESGIIEGRERIVILESLNTQSLIDDLQTMPTDSKGWLDYNETNQRIRNFVEELLAKSKKENENKKFIEYYQNLLSERLIHQIKLAGYLKYETKNYPNEAIHPFPVLDDNKFFIINKFWAISLSNRTAKLKNKFEVSDMSLYLSGDILKYLVRINLNLGYAIRPYCRDIIFNRIYESDSIVVTKQKIIAEFNNFKMFIDYALKLRSYEENKDNHKVSVLFDIIKGYYSSEETKFDSSYAKNFSTLLEKSANIFSFIGDKDKSYASFPFEIAKITPEETQSKLIDFISNEDNVSVFAQGKISAITLVKLLKKFPEEKWVSILNNVSSFKNRIKNSELFKGSDDGLGNIELILNLKEEQKELLIEILNKYKNNKSYVFESKRLGDLVKIVRENYGALSHCMKIEEGKILHDLFNEVFLNHPDFLCNFRFLIRFFSYISPEILNKDFLTQLKLNETKYNENISKSYKSIVYFFGNLKELFRKDSSIDDSLSDDSSVNDSLINEFVSECFKNDQFFSEEFRDKCYKFNEFLYRQLNGENNQTKIQFINECLIKYLRSKDQSINEEFNNFIKKKSALPAQNINQSILQGSPAQSSVPYPSGISSPIVNQAFSSMTITRMLPPIVNQAFSSMTIRPMLPPIDSQASSSRAPEPIMSRKRTFEDISGADQNAVSMNLPKSSQSDSLTSIEEDPEFQYLFATPTTSDSGASGSSSFQPQSSNYDEWMMLNYSSTTSSATDFDELMEIDSGSVFDDNQSSQQLNFKRFKSQ